MDPPTAAEKKDLVESESEDEDYLPPEDGENDGTKSTARGRKRAEGGLSLEDEEEVDDDDDDAEDDDEEDDDDYISDDADAVDTEVATASANGAGPSSATGAGTSNVPADADEKKENGEAVDDDNSQPEETANEKSEANETAEPDRKRAKIDEPSEKIADATNSETMKIATENEAAGENKDRIEKPTSKQMSKIDLLWAEMNAGTSVKPKPKPVENVSHRITAEKPKTVAKTSTTFDPSSFKLPRLQDLEKAADAAKEIEAREKLSKKKTNDTGLEDVLKIVRGDKGSNMVSNTRDKWKDFKQKEGLNEELDAHKKDKNRYTDRVAFLERSDVREWEYEQDGKKRRR